MNERLPAIETEGLRLVGGDSAMLAPAVAPGAKRSRRGWTVVATAAAREQAERLVRAGWLDREPVVEEQIQHAIRKGKRTFTLPSVVAGEGESLVPLSEDKRTFAVMQPAPSRYLGANARPVWLVTRLERPALPLARPPACYRTIPWEPR